MPLAVEHIRRMRGGAQSHLMRCRGADGRDEYYVVKFQNNPQHPRILVNELLASRLAARLGLPTPCGAVIEVGKKLIDLTTELAMQIGTGRIPCRPGFQFGSRYPGDPARTPVHDFLPDENLREVENLADFAGMLVFDKWTCNTNGRQTIFFTEPGRSGFTAWMIDQGFCFNAGEWNFPDAPLRGLYPRERVYESVRTLDSFKPWLDRLENIDWSLEFDRVQEEIPPEWYEDDQGSLFRLLEKLDTRRKIVPELILEAKKTYRQPFPNWK
ncbi:MAG TPA: HipA family kinase [Candidatus Acidoferrales bacterium]|jgi:hypothetical protein|nr:HipA family kinase [Candidatus Acidoferrales bacterium]